MFFSKRLRYVKASANGPLLASKLHDFYQHDFQSFLLIYLWTKNSRHLNLIEIAGILMHLVVYYIDAIPTIRSVATARAPMPGMPHSAATPTIMPL